MSARLLKSYPGSLRPKPSCELPIIIRTKRVSRRDAIDELTRSYNKRRCRSLWIFTIQNRGENEDKDARVKVVLKIVYGLTVTVTTP